MAAESRAELLAFLRQHAPFKDMGAFALDALASSLSPVAVPGGGLILTPRDMPPDLFIIEAGKVQARQAGDVNLTDRPLYELLPGQSFPLAAVAAKRSAINVYSAVEDVLLWRLASADFFKLLLGSCEFNRFVLDHVAGLLDAARRQIEIQFGQRNVDQQPLNSQLSAFLRPAVISVVPQTPIRQAMETMVQAKVLGDRHRCRQPVARHLYPKRCAAPRGDSRLPDRRADRGGDDHRAGDHPGPGHGL